MLSREYNKQELSDELKKKLAGLEEYIRGLGSLAVGFSGGVDSSLLLVIAHEILGDRAIAVTGVDASVPERELTEAKAFCEERGIKHFIVSWNPMQEEGYRNNSPDRSYYCKKAIFSEIKRVADENGIEYLAEDGMRKAVYKRFKEIGFLFVALDMRGYQTGSMNATINAK